MAALVHINKSFETRAEAEKYRNDYIANYHPMGYGTRIDIVEVHGRYYARGTRYSSCD